jgi:hypothetical protein
MDIRKLQKMVGMYVKVDWRQYFDENTSPAVQSYITKNADSLYPWLYDIIKHAISKKLDEVAIIKFIDSKELLNKILNHYISKEEYEKCAEIRDLINKKERKIRKKQKEVVIL